MGYPAFWIWPWLGRYEQGAVLFGGFGPDPDPSNKLGSKALGDTWLFHMPSRPARGAFDVPSSDSRYRSHVSSNVSTDVSRGWFTCRAARAACPGGSALPSAPMILISQSGAGKPTVPDRSAAEDLKGVYVILLVASVMP